MSSIQAGQSCRADDRPEETAAATEAAHAQGTQARVVQKGKENNTDNMDAIAYAALLRPAPLVRMVRRNVCRIMWVLGAAPAVPVRHVQAKVVARVAVVVVVVPHLPAAGVGQGQRARSQVGERGQARMQG